MRISATVGEAVVDGLFFWNVFIINVRIAYTKKSIMRELSELNTQQNYVFLSLLGIQLKNIIRILHSIEIRTN